MKGKILKYDEIPKGKHHIFSEYYSVTVFHIVEDEWYGAKEYVYFTDEVRENNEELIKARVLKDFKGKDATILSIKYQ